MLKAWLLAYAIASIQKRLLQSSSPPVEYPHPFWLLTRVVVCHGSILSKVWSLQKTRGDSLIH